jgi:hypothetical protein
LSCGGSSPIHLPHKTEKEKRNPSSYKRKSKKKKSAEKKLLCLPVFLLRAASPAVFSMIGGGGE